ncbi:hypothetical protein SLA2020_110510 [Shorea laevis]
MIEECRNRRFHWHTGGRSKSAYDNEGDGERMLEVWKRGDRESFFLSRRSRQLVYASTLHSSVTGTHISTSEEMRGTQYFNTIVEMGKLGLFS